MTSSRFARRVLLLASAAIVTASPALAADFTVTAGTTDSTAKTVTGADHAVVQATGTLTASGSQTINLSAVADTGVIIDNAGAIQNTGAGNRAIDSTNTNGIQRTITINNASTGLIQASDDAVRLRGAASGGVVIVNNDGTIKSQLSGQGIDFDGLTGAAVTINNRAGGLIQGADQDGVRPGNGATVNNDGTIQSTIATVYGSYDGIDFQAGGGVVNNTGTITGVRHGITGGDSVALTSVDVNNAAGGVITGQNGSGVGSDGRGNVVNRGTITGAMSGLSPNGDGDGVDIDLIGTVDNYGIIQGTGAVGVDSGGHPNGSEGIAIGGGTITNRAGALISGANTAILVDDGAGGSGVGATTITNAGTIRGLNGSGIILVGPFADTVTNSGTISASGANKAIDFGTGDDTLNLSTGSSITGLIDGGAGTDTLNLSGTGTQAALTNFENLNVASGASWSLTGAQSFATANIAATARLSGLSSVGSLTVNGTIAPGNSIGTTAVSGNLTFTATGVYEAEVDATGAHDLITVGGTAALAGKVSVLAAAGGYNTSTAYTLLTANSVSGTFGSATSNMAFLTPTLSYTPTSVMLTLARNDVLFTSVAQTSNQLAVARAVTAAGTADPIYLAILPQSASGARTEFDMLSGDVHATVRGALLEDGHHARGFAIDRLSGEETGVWGQVLISAANTSAVSGLTAASEGESGFVMGVDHDLAGWRVGAQAGLGDNSVTLKSHPATAQIQEINGSLYAGRSFGPLNIKLGAGAGRGSVNTARSVTGIGASQTLTASYALNTVQVFGEASFVQDLGVAKAEPFVNVAWQNVYAGRFTETGGNTALQGLGNENDATYLTAGLRLNGQMDFAGTKLQPRALLAWRHSSDAQDVARADLEFANSGQGFSVDGAARDKDTGVVELGLEGRIAGNGRVSVLYSGAFSEHYVDNGGRMSFSWGF